MLSAEVEIGAVGGESATHVQVNAAVRQLLFRGLERGLNNFSDRSGNEMQFYLTGFELGHLRRFLDQVVKAVTFFVNDGEQFASLRWIRGGRGKEAGHSRFGGSKWSAKVVRGGIEESGFETFTLPLGFGLAELLDGASPFNGDGDEASNGVQSLPRKFGAGDAQAADGPDPEAYRDEIEPQLSIHRNFVPEESRLHLLLVEVSGAKPRTVKFVFLRKEELGGADFKTIDDVIWNGVHELDDVAFTEEFLTATVKAFDIAAAMTTLTSLFADPRGEVAPPDGTETQRQHAHPLLGIVH